MCAGAVRLAAVLGSLSALSYPCFGWDLATLSDCEALLRTLPGERDGPKCLYEAGRAGAQKEAETRLRRLTEERPDDPWPHRYLGDLHWPDREADEAHGRAIEIFSARGDSSSELETRYSLIGAVLLRRPTEGAEVAWRRRLDDEQRQAEETVARDGEPVARAWLEMAIGRRLHETGENLDEAYQRFRSAEKLLSNPDLAGATGARVTCLRLLAYGAYELGRDVEAEEWERRRVEAARQAGDAWALADAAYNLGAILTQTRPGSHPTHREEVAALLRESLAAARVTRRRSVEANALLLLGKLVGAPEGLEYLGACTGLAEVLGNRLLQRDCVLGLASLTVDEDPDEAARLLQWAETDLAAEGLSPQDRIYGWDDRLHVVWSLDTPEDAVAEARLILQLIESLAERQTAAGQAYVLDTWADVYYWLAGHLLELGTDPAGHGRLGESFVVIERLRSQVLRQILRASKIVSLPSSDTPADLLDRVERELADDEALLSFQYFQDEDPYGRFAGGSWLLVTTARESRAYRLAGRAELEPGIESFLRKDDPASDSAGLAQLLDELMRPAIEDLPAEIRHLVIVPDGTLHRLPFAALGAGTATGALVDRYDLTITPSAALWLRWRQRPQPALPAGALVLAAPEQPSEPDVPAAPTRDRSGLLQYAPREGRSVLKSLPGSRLLLGTSASEPALRSQLAGFSVLHLAAHAVVDELDPSRSAIRLTAAGEHDGRLHPSEIAALEGLEGSLVVLAACSGSGGALLRGEGVMSLARAFFAAGASTVVASLRPLRDDHAAELFDDFYRFLSRGLSVRAALAATQRDHMDGGAPAEAWANLVVLGNGDLVPVPAEPPVREGVGCLRWDELVGLAALPPVALLVALALRRSRRRVSA